LSKKRELKDIIKDMTLTSYSDGEFKYVNSEMVSEALDYLTDKYYETFGDMLDDIFEIIEGLK